MSDVPHVPFVVHPLTVAHNKECKPILVLDSYNPHLSRYMCCFEDHSIDRNLFKNGYFLFTLDLKSAYNHVMILESHCTYLGFHWAKFGFICYFVFNVLPFDISTAGYIFTKGNVSICKAL